MKRRSPTIILSFLVLAVIGAAIAADETVTLEGESLKGKDLSKGFDRGVSYMAPGKETARGSARVAVSGRYRIYARVYFTWAKNEHLLVTVGDKEFVAGTNVHRPFRWDVGSYQVWHWVKAGEIDLKAGDHEVSVKGPGRLDRLVFYRGDLPWREQWLAGKEAHAAGAALKAPSGGDVVFPPSEWKTAGGAQTKALPDTTACLLQGRTDSALRRFRLARNGEFQVWVRLYFYNKNMFEGRTMEEMQHMTYLLLDGCLQGTVMEQNRRRWTWYDLGTVKLEKGEHLVSIAHRGSPVLVGEVVLKRPEGDVEERDWYRKPMPAALPFGIPGGTDPLFAERAGHWLLLGPLGPHARGKWLGEIFQGKPQGVEIELPKQAGRLVMEANHPIECSPAMNAQLAGFFCKGDLTGLNFSLVFLDRNGLSRFAPCRTVAAGDRWNYVHFFLSPSLPSGTGVYAAGDSARAPRPVESGNPFARPRMTLLCERQPMPAQWGTLELTHVVIDSPGGRPRKIQITTPAFNAPVKARVKGRTEENRARLTFALTNNSPYSLDVELHARVGPLGENITAAEADRRWLRFVVPVNGNQRRQAEISLTLPMGGAHIMSYRVGMGETKRLRLPGGKEAQPLLDREIAIARETNCAYENPLWKRDVPLNEVNRRYGKDFRITAGGIDVASLEYAEKHNSIKAFRVTGHDLSDGAGWPEIHVSPGTVAYDPRLGRVKFAEGYDGPCEVVGNFPTGFGVPGGGEPGFFGDYALTPGGEGNFSVFDITRDDRPMPVAMVPSWYFEHDALKFDNFLFFNSSHRGFTMIDDLSNPTRPGVLRRVELDVERWGRVRAVDEKLRILLCDAGPRNGITIFSMEDPLRPKLMGRADGCWGLVATGRPGKYVARTADGLVLLDVNNPAEPRNILEWQFPDGKEQWEKTRILAVRDSRIAYRLPDTVVEVEKRKEKRSVIVCLEYTEKGAKRGFRRLGEPCTDLPASRSILAAFHKGHLYLLNGWSGSGQYGVSPRTPHSEWYTYRIADGTVQKTGEKLVDEFPTAYSQIRIRKNRAYVTEYNIGMWVFDLSNPARPTKVARYYGAAEGDALYVRNGQAYFWQTFGGQIYFIDCKDPAVPVCRSVHWEGAWVSYQNRFRGSNTIWGKDDILYSPRSGRGLAIIDVKDPARPREVGLLNPPSGIYGHCNFRIRDNTLAITQREMVQTGEKKERKHVVRFYDVKDPRKPQRLGEVVVNTGSALYWRKTHLYMAEGEWLTIVNTADPSAPKVASETNLRTSLPGFGEAYISGITVGKGVAYLTARGKGKQSALMVLVDVSDPKQPRPVRIFDSVTHYLPTECSECWANFYQDLVVRDEILIVGSYGRIECFDIGEPLFPRLVAQKDLGFQWSVGMLEGDYLYVPGLAEFVLLRVPASPQRPRGQLKVE